MSTQDSSTRLSIFGLHEEKEPFEDTLDVDVGEAGEHRRFVEACGQLDDDDLAIVKAVFDGTASGDALTTEAQNVKVPLRAAHTILLLAEELARTENEKLLSFLVHLIKRRRVTNALNRSTFVDWERSLLNNPILPADFIEHLWQVGKLSRYQKLEYRFLTREMANNPNCPPTVLRELYAVDDAQIRQAIANHRNIDDELINEFLHSSRPEEKEMILHSRRLSKGALLSLMRDDFSELSSIAKQQLMERFPDVEIAA